MKQHRLWSTLFAVLAGLLVLTFVLARTVHHGWTSGDPTIWIPLHEWLARGAVLYRDVWDQKDWGYFWLHQPLYSLFGVTGLYLTALVVTLVFGTGIYFLTRPLTTSLRAYYMSLFALVLYTASPVYWQIHPENSAISFTVLGVGLIARFPLLAGVTLAGAASMKVSNILIWLLVIASLLITGYITRTEAPWTRIRRAILRLVSGLAIGVALVIVGAALTGSLGGWIEVQAHNREYARWRGFPPAVEPRAIPMTSLQNAFADASELPLSIFAQLITLTLAGLVLWAIWLRRVLAERHSGTTSDVVQQFLLVAALVVGAVVVTIAQRPSVQHWQFVIGALIALVSVGFAVNIGQGKWPPARLTTLLFAVMTVPLVTAANHDGSLAPHRTLPLLSTWSSVGSGSLLGSELSRLPENSSFMFIGTNEYLLDHASLPAGSELACRFFFQFQWFLPRYGEEILECITKGRPDFVVTDASDRWADADFRELTYAQLNSTFDACEETETHVIWCRTGA